MTYTCINNYYMFILMFFCGQFFLLPLYLESFSAWLVFLLPLLVSVSQAILSPVIPTPLLTPDKPACWAFACCLLHSGPYFSACLWEVLWITERVTIGTVSANNIPNIILEKALVWPFHGIFFTESSPWIKLEIYSMEFNLNKANRLSLFIWEDIIYLVIGRER